MKVHPLFLWLSLLTNTVAAELWSLEALQQAPEGWEIKLKVEGELNGDKRSDFALILQKKDKTLIKKDEWGEENFNPRRLVVFLSEQDGYRQALQTRDGFLPSASTPDSHCLEDPLADGSLTIRKSQLYVSLHYFHSCGSWWTTNATYQIRYKNAKFELIGKESQSLHRASLMEEHSSVNYLTNKEKFTTGINQSASEEHRPETKWRTLAKAEQPLTLDVSKLKELP